MPSKTTALEFVNAPVSAATGALFHATSPVFASSASTYGPSWSVAVSGLWDTLMNTLPSCTAGANIVPPQQTPVTVSSYCLPHTRAPESAFNAYAKPLAVVMYTQPLAITGVDSN